MDGYIKLWRKVIENGWLKNRDLWAFWCYCLCKATWKTHTQLIGYQQVKLEPGQFIFGRKIASKELNMSERSIRTCVKNLDNLGNLTIKTTNKFSIITIVNWNTYQGEEIGNDQQSDQQVTSKRPAGDHKQERKNSKKVNNKSLYGKFVRLSDEEHEKLIDRFGQLGAEKWIETLNEGIELKGYKYTSHYLAILKWEKNEQQRNLKSDPFAWVDKAAVN